MEYTRFSFMVTPISMWVLRLFLLATVSVWVFTVLYVDPESGGISVQMLFYGSLFLWLSALIALLLWEVQRFLLREEQAHIQALLRQGCLVGVVGVILLWLQQERLLTWWDGALVVVVALLLELGWREKMRQEVSEPSHPKII